MHSVVFLVSCMCNNCMGSREYMQEYMLERSCSKRGISCELFQELHAVPLIERSHVPWVQSERLWMHEIFMKIPWSMQWPWGWYVHMSPDSLAMDIRLVFWKYWLYCIFCDSTSHTNAWYLNYLMVFIYLMEGSLCFSWESLCGHWKDQKDSECFFL